MLLFSTLPVSAADEFLKNSCVYKEKFTRCASVQNSREITDFVCNKTGNKEDWLVQIIFDEKQRVLDTELEGYLTKLDKNKNLYFWPDAKSTVVEAIDEINLLFATGGAVMTKYYDSCSPSWPVITDAKACMQDGKLTDATVAQFVKKCQMLLPAKVGVYRATAYDTLSINKLRVMQDQKKKFTQVQRTKYDGLLDLMMLNVGYMEKILHKWPSKIKK